jgi:hypothetical protein
VLTPSVSNYLPSSERCSGGRSSGVNATQRHERLPNRRLGETFELEVTGLRYTCTVGRFSDGRLAENSRRTTKATPQPTRMHVIAPSSAASLQYGADVETIRKALCREPRSRYWPPRCCSGSPCPGCTVKRPAGVIAFPLTRRQRFIAYTAKRLAGVSHKVSEKLLAATVTRQATTMARRRIDPN